MAEEALVEQKITDGQMLIEALDRAKFPVQSALWYYYSDAQRWSLIIATDQLKKISKENQIIDSYKSLADVMSGLTAKNQSFSLSTADVKLLGPDDSLLKALHPLIGTSPNSISRIRFTNNSINGIYVEDAVIYRLS